MPGGVASGGYDRSGVNHARAHGDQVTRRQREIAQLVACGLSNAQIAARLGIGRRTVKGHLMAVYRQVGVQSRHELVSWLWLMGLVDREQVERELLPRVALRAKVDCYEA